MPFSGFLSKAVNKVNPSVSFLSVDHKPKTYLRTLVSFSEMSFVLLLLLMEFVVMANRPLFLFLTVGIFEKIIRLIFLIFKIFGKSKSSKKSKFSIYGENLQIQKKLKNENLVIACFTLIEALYLIFWLFGRFVVSLVFYLMDSIGQIVRLKLKRKHSFLSPRVN